MLCVNLSVQLKNSGYNTGCWNYQTVLGSWVVCFIVDMILSQAFESDLGLSQIWLVVAVWQLRTMVRERHNIGGSLCNDFVCAWCCAPCTLTQMVGQMWKEPSRDPGCAFSEGPASHV